MSGSAIIDSIRRKINRSEHHFSEFKTAFRDDSGPVEDRYSSGLHLDPVRQEWRWSANFSEPQPEWGIMVGDAIHQLRSALDHLATQLVFDRTKDKALWRKSAFPIFKCQQDLDGRGSVRKMREALITVGATNEWQAFVDSQPYQTHPATPASSDLWILSELDNIDKHRTIVVVANVVAAKVTSLDPSGNRVPVQLLQPIRPGQKEGVFNWPADFPPRETQSDGSDGATLHPEFFDTDGLCDGKPIGQTLRSIIATVTKTVDDFERKFF